MLTQVSPGLANNDESPREYKVLIRVIIDYI